MKGRLWRKLLPVSYLQRIWIDSSGTHDFLTGTGAYKNFSLTSCSFSPSFSDSSSSLCLGIWNLLVLLSAHERYRYLCMFLCTIESFLVKFVSPCLFWPVSFSWAFMLSCFCYLVHCGQNLPRSQYCFGYTRIVYLRSTTSRYNSFCFVCIPLILFSQRDILRLDLDMIRSSNSTNLLSIPRISFC